MSNRKFVQAIQGFPRKVWKLYRTLTKAFLDLILRLTFTRTGRDTRTAGFILPTTVLLILVVALTVGALTFRAYNRNTQAIGEAQQRVIYNAATPAIDRARSKLEFLFDPTRNRLLPGGVPAETSLYKFLLNDDPDANQRVLVDDGAGNQVSPYDLPDEKRIDVSSDGKLDNAWSFRTDTNGDGKADATVLYSVIFQTPPLPSGSTKKMDELLVAMPEKEKSEKLIVRHGPLGNEVKGIRCSSSSSKSIEEGWFEDSSSSATLRKNFQVDALVIPDEAKAAAVTLEMHQDRRVNRGNKWGAWFRNDLEIYPGPGFNWNGAMHTEGSLIIGGNAGVPGATARPSSGFIAHLISAPASCLYEPASNSEITTTEYSNPQTGVLEYRGVAIAGNFKENKTNSTSDTSAVVYVHGAQPEKNGKAFNKDTDSAKSTSPDVRPSEISIDPLQVLVHDGYGNRSSGADKTNATMEDWNNLYNKIIVQGIKRIDKQSQKAPYIDDLYRADDRWGPKPKYDGNDNGTIPSGTQVGQPIAGATYERLISMPAPPDPDKTNAGVGLDGYWERRARNEGLRILVGERLELGNLNTWFPPQDASGDGRSTEAEEGDPLYPPTVAPYPTVPASRTNNVHEDLQRRTLRDNLSGVQATAIYHRANTGNNDYPVACLATTVHPGNHTTLRQSINFKPTKFVKGSDGTATPSYEYLLSNFFTGRGTNGWEFEPPARNAGDFTGQLAAGQPLRIALENLANFAGDPNGAFPPQANDPNNIHPYPALTMWGNFSNLRRALTLLDSVGYNRLSVADKTYLQTAACTLGILAYNINEIQQFDPANIQNDRASNMYVKDKPVLTDVAERLDRLMDGMIDPASGNFEVLSKAQLGTYGYNPSGSYTATGYKAEDYYEVTPEAFIGGLKQSLAWELSGSTIESLDNDPRIRLAELIMLRHQIRRDRTFGFRPSPAFGEYVVDRNGVNRIFPAACDPDEFPLAAVDRGGVFALGGLRLDGRRALDPATAVTGGVPYNADAPAIPKRNSSDLAELAARPATKLMPNGTYDYDYDAAGRQDGLSEIRDRYARYRLALSRLCGTVRLPAGYAVGNPDLALANQPQVLPKFPSLYYIFPEKQHTLAGADEDSGLKTVARTDASGTAIPATSIQYDHRQPGTTALPGNPVTEPYIADTYINTVNSGIQFLVVSDTIVAGRAGMTPKLHPLQTESIQPNTPRESITVIKGSQPSSRPYTNVLPLPIADRAVKVIAIAPREFPSDLDGSNSDGLLPKLANPPNYTSKTGGGNETALGGTKNEFNTPTNFILAPPRNNPDGDTTIVAVPFLDRAFFDGRQYMLVRTLDVDLGMLRANNALGQANDNWLPNSGIIYAFREDAVREDAIKRPNGTRMDLTDFGAPKDPAVVAAQAGISTKPIDFMPDPDRRIHGFRLRNGRNIRRNVIDAKTEFYFRGVSFFTDQPVYIQGDFNHHELSDGKRLEEFKEQLPDNAAYTADEFYVQRKNIDADFAEVNKDLWRPSEILADSISFLSKDFCDGSIADSFVLTRADSLTSTSFKESSGAFKPDFTLPASGNFPALNNDQRIYNSFGLYNPGCDNNGRTSFHNQNRPIKALGGTVDWLRETSSPSTLVRRNSTSSFNYWADFTSPIKISRAGQPLVTNAPTGANTKPTVQSYASVSGSDFIDITQANNSARLMPAVDTRINSIIVSGIHPSRVFQGYGGLHNFPRFLENWDNIRSFFNGSFLQLNFTNYATASFETEAWEAYQNAGSDSDVAKYTSSEHIPYYQPPRRFWGYDVALQLSPAGPAATRFVTSDKNRSEFYSEPPANDHYIFRLCQAAKNGSGIVPDPSKVNCPQKSN
jgi:hypothetical protein